MGSGMGYLAGVGDEGGGVARRRGWEGSRERAGYEGRRAECQGGSWGSEERDGYGCMGGSFRARGLTLGGVIAEQV